MIEVPWWKSFQSFYEHAKQTAAKDDCFTAADRMLLWQLADISAEVLLCERRLTSCLSICSFYDPRIQAWWWRLWWCMCVCIGMWTCDFGFVFSSFVCSLIFKVYLARQMLPGTNNNNRVLFLFFVFLNDVIKVSYWAFRLFKFKAISNYICIITTWRVTQEVIQ